MLHVAAPRSSILTDPAYDQKYTWGGAKIGELQSKVLNAAPGRLYDLPHTRGVPQIGARITIALAEISSKQKGIVVAEWPPE